jgi:hypothetical protein
MEFLRNILKLAKQWLGTTAQQIKILLNSWSFDNNKCLKAFHLNLSKLLFYYYFSIETVFYETVGGVGSGSSRCCTDSSCQKFDVGKGDSVGAGNHERVEVNSKLKYRKINQYLVHCH